MEEISNLLKSEFLVNFENLSKEVETLKNNLKDTRFEQAIDRQRIAVLERYIDVKETTRRDFDWEATKLRNELVSRKSGMDYNAIHNFCHFKSKTESYRLMDRVLKLFDKDIREIKVGKKNKRVLIKRSQYR